VTVCVWIVSFAVAAGTILGLWHVRASDGAGRPKLWMGVAHGIAGTVGLALLVAALGGPPRGAASGTTAFGPAAAWLFAAALLSGAVILVRRKRGPSITMILHACLAVTGWVLLLAWNALG